MATQPDPNPDTIDPGAPSEVPAESPPSETPFDEPDEIERVQPDYDQPDRTPLETPPPPD